MRETTTTGKLNIAMLGHKHVPSREGGVEIVVGELSTRMAAMGHCVTCYNRSGHHVCGMEYDAEKLREYCGVRLRHVPTIQHKGFAAVSSAFFASLCAAFGPYDVVHVHAEGPAVFCWLPKLFGKRVVITVHGLDHAREKWKGSIGAKLIKQGEKNAVRFADEIIVLSRDVQDYFQNTYHREVRFIPNGVSRPERREPEQITTMFGLARDSYILYLGRIVPEKGIHYLIEAFRNVKTDKKLVIAGGTSDTDDYVRRLQELAEDDERIIFTGFVQGQILDELYSNAYLYVLPSDLEGMPLSLLEAMSYGNCCVVSSIPECTEVVEDKAVIFEKGNTDDLQRKLQDCCDNMERVRQYKAQTADFICRKYDWEQVIRKTIALYQKAPEKENVIPFLDEPNAVADLNYMRKERGG